ncbi:MAG: ABC transporter permease [Bacteroidales bacterium]|jgi:putative ABC transport system permease protein|nr:ABC transporter permease [Bacteroidales bacterium]
MRIEIIHEIASSLRNNKLRTALTGFAVSWGIFLLIALLGAGNGLMNSFMGNISEYISQSITVEGWRTSMPYAGYKEGRNIQLDQNDVRYTKSPRWEGVLENVVTTTPGKSVVLSLNGNTVSGWMPGVMPEYQEQEKMKMAFGRFLNRNDIEEVRKVMVLSLAQAKELVPKNPESILGQWINVGGIPFRVVGVYHTDERSFRRNCPIPYSTYKRTYDYSDKIEGINFSVKGLQTEAEFKALEAEYTGALKRMHSIAPDDNRGLWVNNGYTDNMQMNKATRMIRLALWILGLLTLVSGIVGVSNIMLITVKERTHEFGIRKAIGAKPGAILKLIIAESVFITALFGYAGMFMGMMACQVMDKTIGQKTVSIGMEEIRMLVNPSVGLDVALEATLLLIIAGTLAGIIPAWKAARVKPIEALRAE